MSSGGVQERIDALGKLQQSQRSGSQGMDDALVEPDDDRELDHGGQAGGERVDAAFLVDAHLLGGQLLTVLGILLLDVLPFLVLLQVLHHLGGLQLLRVERPGDGTDQNGEQDDGDAEVMADDVIDPKQDIGKGVNNDLVPHGCFLYLTIKMPGQKASVLGIHRIQQVRCAERRHQDAVTR